MKERQTVRYGFLKLRRYDPSQFRLVKPEYVFASHGCTSEPAAIKDLPGVRQELEDRYSQAAEEGKGFWLEPPFSNYDHCGCTGDALSGFLPCGLHSRGDSDDAQEYLVIAQGVWVDAPPSTIPRKIFARHRSYLVPLS